jgi:hypothetical protein
MARLEEEGLVRSTARQILINDIKAGKIKNISVEEAINMKEPIDPFRQIYGEDALEQLDSLIPNFKGLKTEMEAEQLARSKFKFEPDETRLPGSTSIDEAKKAEQEFGINKPKQTEVTDVEAEVIPFRKKNLEPEEKADGGRIGYSKGDKVTSSIDKLLKQLNKKSSKKKSMKSIDQKINKVKISKKAIDKTKEPTGVTVMDQEPITIVDEVALEK